MCCMSKSTMRIPDLTLSFTYNHSLMDFHSKNVSFLSEIDQGSGRAFLNGEKVEMKHLHTTIETQLRHSSTLSKISPTHRTHCSKIAREGKFSLSVKSPFFLLFTFRTSEQTLYSNFSTNRYSILEQAECLALDDRTTELQVR